MALNKFNNLKVKPGAESSRFVINLKPGSGLSEKSVVKDKNNLIVESKLEKLAELDYGQILKTGGKKAKNNLLACASLVSSRDFWLCALARLSPPPSQPIAKKNNSALGANSLLKPNSLGAKIQTELDQLAFVAIAKLTFIIIKQIIILSQKICYWLGWLIIFCLRLVYFALLSILKPLIITLNFIAGRFKPIIVNGLKFFRTGSKAKTAAAKTKAKRLPHYQESLAGDENEKEIISPSFARRLDVIQAAASHQAGRLAYLKPVLVFAGVLLIMILPVKGYTYYKTIDHARGKVLGASEVAVNNLIVAGLEAANLDFNQAGENFDQASNSFLIARLELEEFSGLLFALGSVAPIRNVQLAAASKHIVRAGELSAEAGKNLSLAFEKLFNYQASESQAILTDLKVYGGQAAMNLSLLNQELAQINSQAIPAEYKKKFFLLKQKGVEFERGLSEFTGLAEKLGNFLGVGVAKRYLLVFQNNAELRASGGFIGSFALMDLLDGKITNLEAPGGGSYDTDAGLKKKIKSPEPLRLVRPDWHFWDANWWPDWPASARKLAWFYENSDGPTVDGVIALTPTVIEEMLKIIGPIDLRAKYGLIIEADNFWQVTQEFAEQKPSVTREPKKIIGDLMNKIIEEMPKRLDKNNLIAALKAVEKLLADKNILFYFNDFELQAEAEAMGWAGKIQETAGDYLSVINTNIAGGKSDRRIKQQIVHQAMIQPDGSIIDNLTIRRTHEAVKGEKFTGVRNVDWLRIYVPLGSELIQAEGFKPVDEIFFKVAEESWQDDPEVLAAEGQAGTHGASGIKIYNELGKTVFANWSQLDPGETIEINIQYKLPFKITDKKSNLGQARLDQLLAKINEVINPEQKDIYSYSLLAQKQPGMNSSTLESELRLSNNLEVIWRYPADLSVDSNGWGKTENLDQDKVMAVILEEK